MWKKLSNEPRKLEETAKLNKNKLYYSRKEISFNNRHSPNEPKKPSLQPLKSKTRIPLEVHVVPAPLKGVLKSEKNPVDKKRVSFDCDPEIRYRTASETSSTSTLKSQKEAEDFQLYFNPKTAPQKYYTEMWSTNKNIQQKSEAEKKFDDLLNSKCSWTYKSIKTVKCQTKGEIDENGPTLKIRTVNYNREKTTHFLFNEYDDIEADEEKKPKKSRKPATTLRQLDSIGKPRVTPVRRSKHNVSYLESDSESSSDDGLVFLSRGCDKIILNGSVTETPQEQISNTFDVHMNDSLLENCNEMDYSYPSPKLQNGGEIIEMEKTAVQHQKGSLNLPIEDYPKSELGLNLIHLENETDLSETLSESDSFEEKKKMKPAQNINNKSDLDSEINRQYMSISTEVQSVCDELKTQSDEISNDFFNENFNLEKYNSKIDADGSVSLREENSSYKSKLLSETKADNSSKISRAHANRNVINNIDRKSENIKNTKNKSNNKTNSMGEEASKIISSTKIKGNYISKFDHIPSVQSDKNGAKNNELEGNGYPLINDYFKGNYSFKSHEINCRWMEQKRSDDSKHDGNTKKPPFSYKKDRVTQQSADSKTKKNASFRSDANEKCVKKTPKTWEDLEVDITNREEQISFLPLFDIKLSSTNKDEKYQPTEVFQSGPNPGNSFESQNNRSITKSKKGCDDNKKINEDSPNANIIDRIIRRMQLCTSPVLTPCLVKPQSEEYQKSPILTDYSYSIQETKSIILTGKKQTKQLKTTWTNTKQQNYELGKKSGFKSIVDSNGANLTSVKLDEIPKKDNLRLLNSSESDNESSAFLEMENLAPELDNYLPIPQDLLIANVDEPYNLRKRKCNDKDYAAKKHIAGPNNTNKSSIINNYKRDKTCKQSRQKTSLIENSKKEDASIENFTLNKRKKCKSTAMDTSTDESETENSSQNQTNASSDQQDRDTNSNNNTLKMSYEENSSQPNAVLTSGKTKELDQKQACGANRPQRRRLPKRDSKEEYEKYLQNIFGKDITEDSNAQWEFLNGMSQGKGNFGTSKPFAEHNDELSLSSDTDFEQSPRRASGLLDDIFN